MSNTLNIVPTGPEAPGPDGRSPNRQTSRQKAAAAVKAQAPAAPDPGQRLMIEEIEAGRFVYTVLDRSSGTVVTQASREEVAEMGQRSDYAAGRLIRAKA